MTAVNTPYTIGPGPAARITDGAGNSPAGCQLINPGTNGGTVWISAGPTAAGLIPLGPGASMTWADPATLPYASLSPAATAAETLLVTSQATDYSNPAAVAAATAVQLATRGIPNVFTDASLGSYRIPGGLTSVPINVAAYGSLVIGVNWPNPLPLGFGVAKLIFTDPSNPDLPASVVYLTNNNQVESALNVYQVPIYAPQLTIKNNNNSTGDLDAAVTGNNRTVPALRQLGDEERFHTLQGNPLPTTEAALPDVSGNGSRQTRMNGRCQLQVFTSFSGALRAYTVVPAGTVQNAGFHCAAGDQAFDYVHPRNPVYWTYQADTAGGACRVNVVCQE